MKNIIFAFVLILGLGLAGCGSSGSDSSADSSSADGSSTDKCPNKEVCGSGCMPTGADCCADGSGYCKSGNTCNSSNLCVASSGGGGGGGGGGSGGVTTCGNCPGNLQCSQVVGCLQSCTCYYTINGSDGTSAWYLVNNACYMCKQNGLSISCDSAAKAAAEAATTAVVAGQC